MGHLSISKQQSAGVAPLTRLWPCQWCVQWSCPIGRAPEPARLPVLASLGRLRHQGSGSEKGVGFGKRGLFIRSGPGKPNQTKASSWTFPGGIPEQKFNVNRACFPKEKHQTIHKNGRNSWTFRFGPFFGLVCQGDSWFQKGYVKSPPEWVPGDKFLSLPWRMWWNFRKFGEWQILSHFPWENMKENLPPKSTEFSTLGVKMQNFIT